MIIVAPQPNSNQIEIKHRVKIQNLSIDDKYTWRRNVEPKRGSDSHLSLSPAHGSNFPLGEAEPIVPRRKDVEPRRAMYAGILPEQKTKPRLSVVLVYPTKSEEEGEGVAEGEARGSMRFPGHFRIRSAT